MTDYDAIVVGSGPNGLAAAITLAQQEWRVLPLEAKETVGGGMRTAELTLPGFHHDICSAIHPLGMGSPSSSVYLWLNTAWSGFSPIYHWPTHLMTVRPSPCIDLLRKRPLNWASMAPATAASLPPWWPTGTKSPANFWDRCACRAIPWRWPALGCGQPAGPRPLSPGAGPRPLWRPGRPQRHAPGLAADGRFWPDAGHAGPPCGLAAASRRQPVNCQRAGGLLHRPRRRDRNGPRGNVAVRFAARPCRPYGRHAAPTAGHCRG
jgi:glycine/D-amino acid oxidase-like deaminating enzyme